MNDGLVIMEKPANMGFDVVYDLMQKGHSIHINEGYRMHTADLNPKELEARVGSQGGCYIAFLNDRPVGTQSYRILKRNKWYHRGEVVDKILAAVDPNVQGKGVYSALDRALETKAKELGFDVLEMDTAEQNLHMQQIHLKKGYHYASYFASPNSDHYSVVMVKWLNGCPFSERQMRWRFRLRRFYIRLRFKPYHKKRFGL